MSTTTEPVVRTYGHWRKPASAGLGSFGLLGTLVIFAGMLTMLITMMLFNIIAAAIVVIPFLIVLGLLLMRDKHGRNLGQRLGTRLAWRKARKAGANVYRSGPLGRTPWGRHQLPGVAARSRLSEHTDSYGRRFALVHMPTTNHYAVVLEVQPDGGALVDQAQIDVWVAHWGNWLANLANETNVAAAAVIIETAPDTGARLRREVNLNLREDAPLLAKSMLRQVVDIYPRGSAAIRAWITLTVRGVDASGNRQKPEAVAGELASRLPHLTATLSATGAGASHTVDAYDLCEIVRIAFDPVTAPLFDQAHADGERVDLDWSDVGPSAHDATDVSYRHDGALSTSWVMSQAPRGLSLSSCLTGLLSPHRDIARKRVALLYRPIPSGVSAGIVEADKRNADFVVKNSTRPSARALAGQAAATATASEEARGAGLVNFGMVVTATVDDPKNLPTARAAVESLSASARILLRPAYGSQDTAFAAALPLGLVLPAHLKVPAALRSMI
ncbi:SCO6880 family protein [Micromonospora sp.]|uniref:SCO6880 family protein n=1 Tax=Micromonospora sp. TaxID=1876 RepID=UPI003B3AE3FD